MSESGSSETSSASPEPIRLLSWTGRIFVLVAAFLGWLFAGTQMSITTLAMRPATVHFIGSDDESRIGMWVAAYVCAFLFGAAAGGLFFGWVGDRIGRTKAMALSITTYSVVSGLTYFAQSPVELLCLRFLTCTGVGGMWPNGVALVSEAWPRLSRPLVAGLIGGAANVGIALMAEVGRRWEIVPEDWRWVMLVGAAPVILAAFVVVLAPESPRWLSTRREASPTPRPSTPVSEVLRPPLLKITLVGILLGTIPLMGGWGSANWVMQWADQVGQDSVPADPHLKAEFQLWRSIASIVGALLGGLFAAALGRRRAYFVTSLLALAISQWMFWFLTPEDPACLYLFGALGFFNGIYFGWLPLCLPELFPTRVRSTGAGVSFNWGRILTAIAVLLSGALLGMLGGYAQLGRVTSLIFGFGMLVIWFAPERSMSRLED